MEDMVNLFGGIYGGKRVLVTGHTGFKGGWLALWLRGLGAEVFGYALPAAEGDNFHSVLPGDTFAGSRLDDVRDPAALRSAIAASAPDIIFHLAAQPLVGLSYRQPVETLTTNALGTALLLEAVREARSAAAVLVVTSDKCYRNDNTGRSFTEDDPLGGADVYSMSKAVTELVARAWHSSFFKGDAALGPVATARAGNVIGGGDYAEDRIVPDAVRAFQSGRPLTLRRPRATRPWQHVLESASGYLALGQHLLSAPDRGRMLSLNFGPDHEAERSVRELMEAWLSAWPGCAAVEEAEHPGYAEAARLSLDNRRAAETLGWRPVWGFDRTVGETARWYRQRHATGADNAAMAALTREQITAYARAAAAAGMAWAN